MQGHIRSILPQKGGVAPIDNNTVALFHYENDAKDSIRGISPLGNRHALTFNAVGGEYLDLGDPGLKDLSNCTVDFWCKTSNAAARWMLFSGQSSGEYLMAISSTFYHSNAGTPIVYVDGAVGTKLIKDGQWHHYAASGVNLSTWTRLTMSDYSAWPTHGSFQDVRIWDSSLSEADIQALMKNKNLTGLSNLHASWKLDENEGNIAYDSSSLGNDGLIVGGHWDNGRATYSLEEGVLLEEGTVNLMPGEASTSGHVFEIQPPLGFSKARKIEIPPDTYGYMGLSPNIPAKPNTGYSLSYYARLVSGVAISGTQMYIGSDTQGTSGVAIARIENEISSQWQRFSISGYTDATATLITRAAMRVQSEATGCIVEVADWQLEEKAFTSSFVENSRIKSSLGYSNPLSTSNGYTFSFWTKIHADSDDGGNGEQPILSLRDPSNSLNSPLFISRTISTKQIRFWGKTTAGNYNWLISAASNTQLDTWTHIAVVMDGNQAMFYLNGILEGTRNDVDCLSIPDCDSLYVGTEDPRWSQQRVLNGVIQGVRIDRIARTAEEVQAWYHHGRGMMG